MPLPSLPEETRDVAVDMQSLFSWLRRFTDLFANSAGEAIDPTLGQGGDGSLSILTAPSGVSYLSGASLSVDNTLFGHIDITFTLPARAIRGIIFYREQGTVNFNTSFADGSPWRLSNLKVGVDYEVQIAGLSANDIIGPRSVLETVAISSTFLDVDTPSSVVARTTYQSIVITWNLPSQGIRLEFEIQSADDSGFTSNVKTYNVDVNYFIDDLGAVGITRHYRVRAVSSAGQVSAWSAGVSGTTENVPNESIGTYKKVNLTDHTEAISLTGTGAAVEVLSQGFVVNHNLNKMVVVMSYFDNASGLAGNARIVGISLRAVTVNQIVADVMAIFIGSTATITCDAHVTYW